MYRDPAGVTINLRHGVLLPNDVTPMATWGGTPDADILRCPDVQRPAFIDVVGDFDE